MRFFSGTELKIIGITVGAATVAALAITISVGLARREKRMPQQHQSAGVTTDLPYITDIVIPEEFTLTGGERWYFSREPLKKWSENQVDLFWIDPAEIGIDLMKEESDRIIREFVAELP